LKIKLRGFSISVTDGRRGQNVPAGFTTTHFTFL